MHKPTVIVWFRRDLRLADNPALMAAIAAAGTIVPVFIHAPAEEAPWEPGAASNWWLHQSLLALQVQLGRLDVELTVRAGDSFAELQQLISETGASAVYWNRLYEPAIIQRDKHVQAGLEDLGVETRDFGSALLLEPGQILNKAGKPYKVFTPFWRTALTCIEATAPDPAPDQIVSPPDLPSVPIDDLGLLPVIPWDKQFYAEWSPGENGAHQQLESFVGAVAGRYATGRDIPSVRGTSRLSPHLHFGELSPRQVYWAAKLATAERPETNQGTEIFLKELGWREFAHHLMVHFPYTTDQPLRPDFRQFPWLSLAQSEFDEGYKAWCTGQTGIPLIDAGMRELWSTGWMHNRVRMVVASFLTKNQLISWEAGAHWFWDTLVDANLASNTLGWQWSAGCGADAAPFFRIFNPVRQGEKFDADELYIRKWCPELEAVPKGAGHAPWLADGRAALPVVDLADSRRLALEAFAVNKQTAAG